MGYRVLGGDLEIQLTVLESTTSARRNAWRWRLQGSEALGAEVANLPRGAACFDPPGRLKEDAEVSAVPARCA